MTRRESFGRAVALAIAVMFLSAASAWADLPGHGPRPVRPFPRPAPDAAADTKNTATDSATAPLSVTIDPQAKESTLIIPKKFLSTKKLSMDEAPSSPGGLRQGMAAVALSCAITGLFFVRRNRQARLAMSVVICLVAIGGAASVLANAPAPPDVELRDPASRRPDPVEINGSVNLPTSLSGKVAIKVTDDGDTVKLVLAAKSGDAVKGRADDLKKSAEPVFTK